MLFLSKVPQREATEAEIKLHVQYLRELERQGVLVLCGPFTDGDGGMVIVRAADKDAAGRIAAADPFVQAGVRSCAVRTWKLSCEDNNHLGMG